MKEDQIIREAGDEATEEQMLASIEAAKSLRTPEGDIEDYIRVINTNTPNAWPRLVQAGLLNIAVYARKGD